MKLTITLITLLAVTTSACSDCDKATRQAHTKLRMVVSKSTSVQLEKMTARLIQNTTKIIGDPSAKGKLPNRYLKVLEKSIQELVDVTFQAGKYPSTTNLNTYTDRAADVLFWLAFTQMHVLNNQNKQTKEI